MLDFDNIEKYRENNRIEAKTAMGGLPHSIWETYSAFANTFGGIILLGVTESEDKSFDTVNLPCPEEMIDEFISLLNNPKKASVNILSGRDVYIRESGGDRIIVINVPRADRMSKPVYIDGSPENAYRRSGEGDYRCTAVELAAMLRDAAVKTQDMRVLEYTDFSALNAGSVAHYRTRMRMSRPGHAWNTLDDGELLSKLGAADEDGAHLSAAGLLMFGSDKAIRSEFGGYCLDYRETADISGGIGICSSSGGFSGNVSDFCFKVCDRFRLLPECRGEDGGQVLRALCEALANCLVNADYHGTGGVRIVRSRRGISFSNPGGFRIRPETAKSGGVSDARNSAMQRIFNMIDIGERTGGGIPDILKVWEERGWREPVITEGQRPDRTTLTLEFIPRSAAEQRSIPTDAAIEEGIVIDYLTDNVSASTADIALLPGIGASDADAVTERLLKQGVITVNSAGLYTLMS